MLLSDFLAGSKWAIQMVLGYLPLCPKHWIYLSQLRTACAIRAWDDYLKDIGEHRNGKRATYAWEASK